MKLLTVGNLKTHFSDVLDNIKKGEEYTIEFGRKKDKIAVIIPYKKYVKHNKKRIGILKKGNILILKNFKITDEDFFNS